MSEELDSVPVPIICHYNSPQRSMNHMKNPTTLVALSLLVALITLQSTQAADILVDDFTSTSFTGDSGRLKENRIDLGWQTHWNGAISSWAIAGEELTTASGTSTDQEGGVAQVFSYGADANTEVTFSFDYNVTADDTLSVHLWGIDGTYATDPGDSRIVNYAVLGGGMYWMDEDANVDAYALQGGGATPGAALVTLSGSGTYSTTINIDGLGVAGVINAGDFEYYMLGFARDVGATAGTTSIDNLSFTSVVPEPGTYALLAGLTGLVFAMVRRRR
jgi:hypothetical protein